ncbi:MAG: hypothetical protein COX17_04400 [Deltaproteobacteria bacterium CG23_combo_of_CG06-09_8_20_14_all_60_8]|nr:MAG: hypothetical protein AUK28_07100 [Desulfobacterales bacterium CG2_30_60_27]PIP43917.1 MAG: hypothetical protein COX17_04400 [Deltaproteobacteria bacterium CG23_combo_of_CG06-09_8_20_14_all_60_8]
MQDLEAVVRELGQTFRLKGTTAVGDVVLIMVDNPLTMLYGLVTGIERDASRLDEWWHLAMQLLSFPPQHAVWTLRTPQFTGREIFTMGGEKRFVKALDFGGQDGVTGNTIPTVVKKPTLRRIK